MGQARWKHFLWGLKVNGIDVTQRKLIVNVEISTKNSDPGEWKADEARSSRWTKQTFYIVSCTIFDVAKIKVILKTRNKLTPVPSVRFPLLG